MACMTHDFKIALGYIKLSAVEYTLYAYSEVTFK